jgi:hypothetical protein
VQIEATDAINHMYNFNFDQAEQEFKGLKELYGWHPLPYFLHGLSYWWRMVPNIQDERWDEPFLTYMDSSLVLSERLYEEVNEVEGAFFLAATYSFQGRLYSERKMWRKAAVAGKKALEYLDEIRDSEDFSPELLFGDALFNYYAVWVPENYPILKPIMVFFPEGDKQKGIEQLKEVARNAFYTRTEAQYFLMRILHQESGDVLGAFQVAEYLHNEYPRNPYFHRYYARLLYQMGRYNETIESSKAILQRLDSGYSGYEFNSGRYASFFLGHIYEMREQNELAAKYFKMSKEFGELIDATDKGYYIYSVLHLGLIAEESGEYEKAMDYFQQVRKITKRRNSANERAREHIKTIRDKT